MSMVLSSLLWFLIVDEKSKSSTAKGIMFEDMQMTVIVIKGKHDLVFKTRTSSKCYQNHSYTYHKQEKNMLKQSITERNITRTLKEIKYLEAILDQGLNWNRQIDRIIYKATIAYWSCQRVFGKTWELLLRTIYWLHRTVIIPMVTYVS